MKFYVQFVLHVSLTANIRHLSKISPSKSYRTKTVTKFRVTHLLKWPFWYNHVSDYLFPTVTFGWKPFINKAESLSTVTQRENIYFWGVANNITCTLSSGIWFIQISHLVSKNMKQILKLREPVERLHSDAGNFVKRHVRIVYHYHQFICFLASNIWNLFTSKA